MEQELYLYIASFDDVLENFKGNLLDIQKEYVFSDRKITFNPIIFYCNNVSEILVHSIKKMITITINIKQNHLKF